MVRVGFGSGHHGPRSASARRGIAPGDLERPADGGELLPGRGAAGSHRAHPLDELRHDRDRRTGALGAAAGAAASRASDTARARADAAAAGRTKPTVASGAQKARPHRSRAGRALVDARPVDAGGARGRCFEVKGDPGGVPIATHGAPVPVEVREPERASKGSAQVRRPIHLRDDIVCDRVESDGPRARSVRAATAPAARRTRPIGPRTAQDRSQRGRQAGRRRGGQREARDPAVCDGHATCPVTSGRDLTDGLAGGSFVHGSHRCPQRYHRRAGRRQRGSVPAGPPDLRLQPHRSQATNRPWRNALRTISSNGRSASARR